MELRLENLITQKPKKKSYTTKICLGFFSFKHEIKKTVIKTANKTKIIKQVFRLKEDRAILNEIISN
jgi:hypothetical protein